MIVVIGATTFANLTPPERLLPRLTLDKRGRPAPEHRRLDLKATAQAEAAVMAKGGSHSRLGKWNLAFQGDQAWGKVIMPLAPHSSWSRFKGTGRFGNCDVQVPLKYCPECFP